MRPCDNIPPTDPGIMPFGWYAVYTRHQHEKSAAQFLTRKGYQVLLPLYRTESRWSDRKQVVLLPLFPSYLFVQADLEHRVDVLHAPGVCWFVGNAGTPSEIYQEDLETIRRLAKGAVSLRPHPYLECGSDVRITWGPLAGLRGVLVRVKNGHRVVISVEILRKSTAVEVELSSVERISTQPHGSPCQAEIHKY